MIHVSASDKIGNGDSAHIAKFQHRMEFDPANLDAMHKKGRKIFVNVTASWCITCKINEYRVFKKQEVIDLFNEQGIYYVEADWTKADAQITQYLEGFSRSGVPLYVYYDARGEVSLLPQMLSIETITEALN